MRSDGATPSTLGKLEVHLWISVGLQNGQSQAVLIQNSIDIDGQNLGGRSYHWYFLYTMVLVQPWFIIHDRTRQKLTIPRILALVFPWVWDTDILDMAVIMSTSGDSIQKSLLTQLLLTAYTILEGSRKSFKSSNLPVHYIILAFLTLISLSDPFMK